MADTSDIDRLTRAVGGRYAIVRELGRGGMATVYLAQDHKHARDVAIKVLRPELYSLTLAERFLAEITVTAGLQHPHILPLFDSGADDRLLYYVMPFVRGETLRDRLRTTPQLPVAEAVRIACEVAGALDYAHRLGVIHRDIKPENILLQDDAALVADFGIAFTLAKSSQERLTATGLAIGTPAYMSPEQAAGEREVDARSDVYAVGAMLYEMLAGTTPHTADSAGQLLVKVLTTDPVSILARRSDVSPDLSRVIAKALAREPAERWSTAGELVRALRGDVSGASPTSAMRPRRRGRMIGGGLAVAALAAAALVAAKFWQPSAQAPVLTAKRQVTFEGNVENSSISPDGRFVAYAAHGEDSLSIRVQDLSGGNPITLATFANADLAGIHWSPDGTRLLVLGATGNDPIAFIVPRLGGTVRQLPYESFGLDGFPVGNWLPSGEDVGFWGENAQRAIIYSLQSGDTTSQSLPAQKYTMLGSWSRHSRTLLIKHGTDSSTALWTVSPEGAAKEILGDDPSAPFTTAVWAPNDQAIFALRGLQELVWMPMGRDGMARVSGAKVVASGLESWSANLMAFYTALSVTSDGTKGLYTRSVDHANLVVMTADGRTTALTTGTTMKVGGVMSPDGSRIAYALQADPGSANLWILDRATQRSTQLTFDGTLSPPSRGNCLSWSPDGARLAFNVDRQGVMRIGITGVNDNGAIKVVPNSRADCSTGISWAPAPRIVYTDGSKPHQIRSLNAETYEDSIMVSLPGSSLYGATSTADGKRVAFRRQLADPKLLGLWVAEAGRPPRLVAAEPVGALGWSDDNTAIFVRAIAARDISRITLDGRSQRVARSPRRDDWCTMGGKGQNTTFVCTQYERNADAFLLELRYP